MNKAKQRFREKNNNWRGGRSITNHGYIIIRVNSNHHLADSKSYAYEHRLVAEKMLGRRLLPKEIVHHIDGNKKNNIPENLKVVLGNANHYLNHRKKSNRRKPNENNPVIFCKCGCETEFKKFDKTGRPRIYISGHNNRKGIKT